MITNSMEPDQESELVSLAEDYANEIRAWDKKQIGARPELSRQDIVDYVGSLLAAKDAEIARLQARQITPEIVHVAQMYLDGMTDKEMYLYLPLLMTTLITLGEAK